LAAATAVLSRDGAHGFRLRAVATEAGLGLSHVQYYFPSLEALLAALVDRYLADWDLRLGETCENLPSIVEAVLDSQVQGDDCRLIWELWAMSSRDGGANAAVASFYAAYLERVAKLTAAVRPDFSAQAALDCAVLVVALLEGLSVLRGAGRETALAPHARTQTVAAVIAIIEAFPGTGGGELAGLALDSAIKAVPGGAD
jgi:AcrR family transcriptional regulator